jgi:hypothetical protein
MTKLRSVFALAVVLNAAILSGCAMSNPGPTAIAAQQNAMEMQSDLPLPHDEMVRMIAADNKQAQAGLLPPEAVKLDIAMYNVGDK